mgnify:CR=1 FL=1
MVEIKTAIEACNKLKPEVLLLDGSILPHYTDKPARTSGVYGQYKKMIDLYKELYRICEANNIMLAGVIEDSRGTRFCDIIENNILSKIRHKAVEEIKLILRKTRDTNLLFYVLERGQRTIIFNYADRIEKGSILSDMKEYAEFIRSFYLKTASYDRPIRVDFIGNEKVADEIAGILLAISGHHSGYGIPTVLIEADQVAKLRESEIDHVYSQLVNYTSLTPGMFKLRRDSRPF